MTAHKLEVAFECVESGLYETLQYPLSYLASDRELELVALCEQRNVGFIAMKGPEADAEAKAAANALKKLGGQYEETRAFTLPDGSARGLVFCKKISQTPTVYPRNGGKIAKKPL